MVSLIKRNAEKQHIKLCGRMQEVGHWSELVIVADEWTQLAAAWRHDLWAYFPVTSPLANVNASATMLSISSSSSAAPHHSQRQSDHFFENLKMSGNFAVVREMLGKIVTICMVRVAVTDYDMINAKSETQCNHGSLASKQC